MESRILNCKLLSSTVEETEKTAYLKNVWTVENDLKGTSLLLQLQTRRTFSLITSGNYFTKDNLPDKAKNLEFAKQLQSRLQIGMAQTILECDINVTPFQRVKSDGTLSAIQTLLHVRLYCDEQGNTGVTDERISQMAANMLENMIANGSVVLANDNSVDNVDVAKTSLSALNDGIVF